VTVESVLTVDARASYKLVAWRVQLELANPWPGRKVRPGFFCYKCAGGLRSAAER
jgi:hypothetical protein